MSLTMIDFHTHILPGIDDGSRNLNMTKEMIKGSLNQGVRKIALTPHFYAEKDDPARFLSRRNQAYVQMLEYLSQDLDVDLYDRTLPEFKLGAEVLFFPGISNSKSLIDLCFEDTRLLLLEMPFQQWTKDTYREVKEIIEKQELTVIIAHIERFIKYQKDKAVWREILKLPIISQMNAECFLSWRTRGFAYRYIKEGYEIILGTDAHNITSRPVNLEEGRMILKKKFGECILTEIDEISEKLWRNNEA